MGGGVGRNMREGGSCSSLRDVQTRQRGSEGRGFSEKDLTRRFFKGQIELRGSDSSGSTLCFIVLSLKRFVKTNSLPLENVPVV